MWLGLSQWNELKWCVPLKTSHSWSFLLFAPHSWVECGWSPGQHWKPQAEDSIASISQSVQMITWGAAPLTRGVYLVLLCEQEISSKVFELLYILGSICYWYKLAFSNSYTFLAKFFFPFLGEGGNTQERMSQEKFNCNVMCWATIIWPFRPMLHLSVPCFQLLMTDLHSGPLSPLSACELRGREGKEGLDISCAGLRPVRS